MIDPSATFLVGKWLNCYLLDLGESLISHAAVELLEKLLINLFLH